MKAFLKRRWILLLCVVVLVLFTVLDAGFVTQPTVQSPSLDGGIVFQGHLFVFTGKIYPVLGAGVESRLLSLDGKATSHGYTFPTERRFHTPTGGSAARLSWEDDLFFSIVPLWIPLSAVLGWLVIRELRWKEKRAKAEESATTATQ